MALFKLHVPFLDQVKEKGIKTATLEKIDEGVNRLTAGMGIADVRSALRGDPPPRPNPRTKPHADGFWMHMRPTYFNEKIMPLYPTFRLGWMAVYFTVFETITGVILMFWYTPSPLIAFENMLDLLGNVPLGQFMRDLHRIGAEFMVAVVALHMLRTFMTGSYKKPRQFTWFTGVVLLGATIFLSFSGYLLPWDQLSLWAVTIGASMGEATPFIGNEVNLILRGAPQIGDTGLLRWYMAHVLGLPLVLFVFTGVHYYKVIIHGHSLPPDAEEIGEDTARRVPMKERAYFIPDIMTREVFWVVALTALQVFIVTLGGYHAALEPHADPLVTPLHTTAPWYFLWLQGMLKFGDKVFWGVIAPGIIANVLLVLPYIEVGPSRRYADRRIGLSVMLIAVVALSITTFMGTPFYAVESSPDQEVIAELMPETHPGPVRAVGYDKLPVGTYYAIKKDDAPNGAVKHLLEEMYEAMEREYDDPEDYEASLIVEQWQPNLKRITARVTWEEDGQEIVSEKSIYLHADSIYEE